MNLKIKDDNGNWISVPYIRGPKGDKGEKGETGAAGAPGSDAEVTKSNIIRALQYTPADENDVYTKEEVYTKKQTEALVAAGGGTGGGGILLQEQTDWEQNDSEAVDFLKNRPFYEIKKSSYYSQIEDPEPYSFEVPELEYTYYKVSDLVFTKEELLNEAKAIIQTDSVEQFDFIFEEDNLLPLESENAFVFQDSKTTISLLFVDKSGDITFTYQGYSTTVYIEESGVYFVRFLGKPLPDGLVVEISNDKIKQIDEKFLPGETFGQEIEIIEIFKEEENPSPIFFENELLNMTAYKISNATYTLEQLQKGIIFIINGSEVNSQQAVLSPSADGNGILVEFEIGYVLAIGLKEGKILADDVNGIYFDIPETGTYVVMSYGGKIPEGLTIEFRYNNIKKIQDKFIDNVSWNKIIDIPFEGKERVIETLTIQDGDGFKKFFESGLGFRAVKLFDTILTKEQIRNDFLVKVGYNNVVGVTLNLSDATIEDNELGFFINASNDSKWAVFTKTGILYHEATVDLGKPAKIPAGLFITEEDLGFYILGDNFEEIKLHNGFIQIEYEKDKTIETKILPKLNANFDQTDPNKIDFIENRPFGLIESTKHIIKFMDVQEYLNLSEEEQELYLGGLSAYKVDGITLEKDKINEVFFNIIIKQTKMEDEEKEDGSIEKVEKTNIDVQLTVRLSDEQYLLSILNEKMKTPIFSLLSSNPELENALVDSMGAEMIQLSLLFPYVYDTIPGEVIDVSIEELNPGVYINVIPALLFNLLVQDFEECSNTKTNMYIEAIHNIYQKAEEKYIKGKTKDFVFTQIDPYEAGLSEDEISEDTIYFDCNKRELMNLLASIYTSNGYSCDYRTFLKVLVDDELDMYVKLQYIGGYYFKIDNFPYIDVLEFDTENFVLNHYDAYEMFPSNQQDSSSTFSLRKIPIKEKLADLAKSTIPENLQDPFNPIKKIQMSAKIIEIMEKIKEDNII